MLIFQKNKNKLHITLLLMTRLLHKCYGLKKKITFFKISLKLSQLVIKSFKKINSL